MELGNLLAQSGFFADSRGAAQAVVKVLAGREIGFGPIAAMTGIHVIQGRVSLSANLMAAAIKRSGRYDYRVKTMTADLCEIEFRERVGDKWEVLGLSTFNSAEAKIAGTKNMDKFPRNMLFARAMSNGARWFTPDIFGGPVYTPEELGATVNGETGEVIDMTPVVRVEQPAPQPVTTTAPQNGNGKTQALEGRPHWHSVDDAVLWGVDQGVFHHPKHAQNAYNKLRTEALASDNPPRDAVDMFNRWYADVLLRLENTKAGRLSDEELDAAAQELADASADERAQF
jgi:hypothetical protein